MPRTTTSRFGLAAILLVAGLCASNKASAITASPNPSTNGSYAVHWGMELGCTYNYIDIWLWTSECYKIIENGSWHYYDYMGRSFTGKAPGTYTYDLEYEYMWVESNTPVYINTYVVESVSVQVLPPNPSPSAWSLTDDQRRAYLNYYAPIVFKRANEDTRNSGFLSTLASVAQWAIDPSFLGAISAIAGVVSYVLPVGNGGAGYDWITNFYYDGTDTFSDNKYNWKMYVTHFITSTQVHWIHWNIRPTLYTAAIEFMEQGSKELVLIYHIYHAIDENAGREQSVHDWERIEVHLKNVAGSPGSIEEVYRTVITQHHRHLVRSGSEVNFLQDSSGKHLMVFQAEWSGRTSLEPHGQELRYVTDPWSWVYGRMVSNGAAEVDITGDSRKNIHYVFVPEEASQTVYTFSAWAINWVTNRFMSFSGRDNGDTVAWDKVRRITYELQDLADIFPTHAPANNAAHNHWYGHPVHVRMTDPVLSEDRLTVELDGAPSGTTYALVAGSADVEGASIDGSREGYPDKSWWWGCYAQHGSADIMGGGGFCADMLNGTHEDSRGRTRLTAAGPGSSPGIYSQHDYFVHARELFAPGNPSSISHPGYFLVGDWHKPANGGFDGRYVQLFDDRRPLRVTLEMPWNFCSTDYYPMNVNDGFLTTVQVSGAKSPYTLTWTIAGSTWYSTYPTGGYFEYVPYGTEASVTVNAANGESVTYALDTGVKCTGFIS
jgi:hypothetical protein